MMQELAAGLSLRLDGVGFAVAEDPHETGLPHMRQGRQSCVYALRVVELPPGELPEAWPPRALKLLDRHLRGAELIDHAAGLTGLADLPGLAAARRSVLDPGTHWPVLRRRPELTHAILMPWLGDSTWADLLRARRPLTPARALSLAQALAEALATLEGGGYSHRDLSGSNLILTGGASNSPIALVDLEHMSGPGLAPPARMGGGTPGYEHPAGAGEPDHPAADRFAGAVLLAELLGWCDEHVRAMAWGASYFAPGQLQQEGERYRVLTRALRAGWGQPVADLLEHAWRSPSPDGAADFAAWRAALRAANPAGAEPSSAPPWLARTDLLAPAPASPALGEGLP